MKQVVTLVFAGIIGGIITLAGFQFLNPQNPTKEKTQAITKKVNNNYTPPAVSTYPFNFADASEKAMQAVVHIKASESNDVAQQRRQGTRNQDPFGGIFDPFFRQGPREGTGSGVIISQDGYIVTNNHVIEFADEVAVTLFDNRTLAAEVIGTYPKTDLAVLKIDADDLPILKDADSDKARVGEWVLAVGNPLELNSTVTAGIISAKGRNLNIIDPGKSNDKIEAFIQTDAAVNPGNSGGALVDAKGDLLGINTAIKSQTGFFAGYSFAIPINLVRKIVDDIIQYGSYQRAYLGVRIFDLDSDYAAEKGLNLSQGVVVEGLQDGGSAQYAGLLAGDVIIAIDNKEVKSSPELQEIIGRAKVGDTIQLKINRSGEIKSINVYMRAG